MISKTLQTIKLQQKIPIIGKGSYEEILNKANNYINLEYKVIEITLRSKNSLEVAIRIKKNNPNIFIGLGSIVSIDQLIEFSKYNFNFYVSPGINSKMLEFAKEKNLFFIPGISSPSEILSGIEYDINLFKFFPAEQSGGINILKTYKDIFPDITFIPTGGINNTNCDSYIELSNVIGVGSTNF